MTSKLISCLSVLSKEEWASFRKFLLMKTGEESDNFLLFKALQKRKSKLGDMKNADKIWQEEFSHMSQKAFANLQSRVTQWLEEWLAYFDFQRTKYKQKLQLIEGYNKRGLYQLADQVYAKTLKQLGDDESIEHNYILSSLHKAQYYSDNPIKYSKGAALLEDVVHSYFSWHSKQVSIFEAELYNWGDIQQVEFAAEKEICNQIKVRKTLSPVYELIVQLVREKEPKYLLKLVDKIESNKIDEHSLTYVILLNYCLIYYMRLFNGGKIDKPDVLIKLYSTGMKNGSFFSNGKIPIRRFHNIVNAISTCVTKQETDQFIEQWADLVSTSDLESSKKVALALSCLSYKKYSEIILLLRGIKFEDLIVKLVAGAVLIIAIYEEGEEYYDSLLNHLFNFKRQVKRNQFNISDKQFIAYLNLCDFIENIISQNKSVINNIDLSEYSYLMYRSWAKRKLGILQNNK